MKLAQSDQQIVGIIIYSGNPLLENIFVGQVYNSVHMNFFFFQLKKISEFLQI